MAALVTVVMTMMVVEVVIVTTVIMGSHCDSKRKMKNLFENI